MALDSVSNIDHFYMDLDWLYVNFIKTKNDAGLWKVLYRWSEIAAERNDDESLIQIAQIYNDHGDFEQGNKFASWMIENVGEKALPIMMAVVGAGAIYDIARNIKNNSNNSNNTTIIPSTPNIGDSQSVNVNSGWTNLFKGIGDIASSIGSSLGGLVSQFGSSWFNKKNMKELIDYQNEYNTPANQMQRFADAGLNPNLIYGLGSNGNQPSSGSIAPVDFDTSQRENRMAQFQMSMQGAQVKADIAEKQSATNLNNQNASLAADNAEYQKLVNTTYMQQFEANLQQTIATTDNLIAQKRSILADIEQKIQNTHESKAREQLLIAQRETENALRDVQKQKIQAETALAQFNAHSGPFKIALDIGKVDGDSVGSTLYDNTPELFKRGYNEFWKLGKRLNKNKSGSKF